uniref:Uncharacterized protein n=1 Tax=Anguilla anguilla TaxID=7936 RepID=A0A0E9VA90_ANGAN
MLLLFYEFLPVQFYRTASTKHCVISYMKDKNKPGASFIKWSYDH